MNKGSEFLRRARKDPDFERKRLEGQRHADTASGKRLCDHPLFKQYRTVRNIVGGVEARKAFGFPPLKK